MQLRIRRPDDWHLHLRDGEAMHSVLPYSAKQFARAIIMPNLKPPVTTVERALQYRQRILQAVPEGMTFEPLMTLYLTDQSDPQEFIRAKQTKMIHGAKLYPAGATTNSASGVTNIRHIDDVLAAMAEVDMPLLVHGEVTDHTIDIFDREAEFLRTILPTILQRHPTLRVVLEHITTAASVEFVKQASKRVAATITAHHLLVNRNAMLAGGIRPHYYCLPILKTEIDRKALVEAAVSGDPQFFLGTDSAPHAIGSKESSCGCAGCFTAYCALELYAEVFEQADALDKLEGFASFFGADFYQLERNKDEVILQKTPLVVPSSIPFGDQLLRPFGAGEQRTWMLT